MLSFSTLTAYPYHAHTHRRKPVKTQVSRAAFVLQLLWAGSSDLLHQTLPFIRLTRIDH